MRSYPCDRKYKVHFDLLLPSKCTLFYDHVGVIVNIRHILSSCGHLSVPLLCDHVRVIVNIRYILTSCGHLNGYIQNWCLVHTWCQVLTGIIVSSTASHPSRRVLFFYANSIEVVTLSGHHPPSHSASRWLSQAHACVISQGGLRGMYVPRKNYSSSVSQLLVKQGDRPRAERSAANIA